MRPYKIIIIPSSFNDLFCLGNLWGAWLNKSSDLNFSKLCQCMRGLAENQEIKKPCNENCRLCNRIFWNLIASNE